MTATGQYSTAVLFIMLSMMVLASFFCFLNSESLWDKDLNLTLFPTMYTVQGGSNFRVFG